MNNSGKITELAIWLLLFTTVYLLKQYISIYILFPPIILMAFLFWLKGKNLLQAQLALFIISSSPEVMVYLYCLVLLVLFIIDNCNDGSFKVPFNTSLLFLYIFFFIGILSYGITQFYEVNFLSLPLFLITFGSPISALFYFWKLPLGYPERKSLLRTFLIVAVVQSLIAYYDQLIGVSIRSMLIGEDYFPDKVMGTFHGQLTFAYFLFLVCMLYSWVWLEKGFLAKISIGFILFIGFVSNARTYFLSIIASYMGYLLLINPFVGHRFKMASILLSFVLFCGAVGIGLSLAGIPDKYLKYAVGDENHKLVYIQRAIDVKNRNLLQYLIGTGPGTCGSRTSNARASDVLWKDPKKFSLPGFIPKHSSKYTKFFLGDLYTPKYAFAKWRSALLGNPFNSFASIFIEFGLIGYLVFLMIPISNTRFCVQILNGPSVRASDKAWTFGLIIFGASLVIVSFVDQILERAVAMYLFWFIMAITLTIRDEVDEKEPYEDV